MLNKSSAVKFMRLVIPGLLLLVAPGSAAADPGS